jgi:hypothetical protein
MTQQSNTHERTSRPDMQHEHKPRHHATNLAQITYQHPLKIKNGNTHLGITIRWVQEPPTELILVGASGVVG